MNKEKSKINAHNILVSLIIIFSLIVLIVRFGLVINERIAESNEPAEEYIEEPLSINEQFAQLTETDDPDSLTIDRIEDVDILRKENPNLYIDAENGHYLVIDQEMVYIYDFEENKIIEQEKLPLSRSD